MTHPLNWIDQPKILEQAPVVCRFHLDGKMVEVRKLTHPNVDHSLWFITAGNMFGSQTVKCPSAEKVLELIHLAEHRPNKDQPASVPEGCELIPSEKTS